MTAAEVEQMKKAIEELIGENKILSEQVLVKGKTVTGCQTRVAGVESAGDQSA